MKIVDGLQCDRKRVVYIKGETFCRKHFQMGKGLVLQEG